MLSEEVFTSSEIARCAEELIHNETYRERSRALGKAMEQLCGMKAVIEIISDSQ